MNSKVPFLFLTLSTQLCFACPLELPKDTIELYQDRKGYLIDKKKMYFHVCFMVPKSASLGIMKIVLEEPQLISPSDGVFEIYVYKGTKPVRNLHPSTRFFLSTLDLYNLTEIQAKSVIILDVSDKIRQLNQTNSDSNIPCTLTIKFVPNTMTGHSPPPAVGILKFSGAKVLQIIER